MSVLIEAISVIVQTSALRAKYPGGVDAYERDAPNGTYCSDGHLTRVGFMAPPDVKAFVDRLTGLGFLLHNRREFIDIAVVDQMHGPTSSCSWLECGRHQMGFAMAWLPGTNVSPMAAPHGWTVEQSSRLNFVSNEDVPWRALPLLREGMVDSVLDYATGKIMYVGRTTQNQGLTIPKKNE